MQAQTSKHDNNATKSSVDVDITHSISGDMNNICQAVIKATDSLQRYFVEAYS